MREIIDRLAQSYIPEWRIDWENKDAGAELAEIFMRQMEDNGRALQQTENMPGERLAGLMGITLKPPKPASGIVQIKIAEGMAEGVRIKRGTKLYALSEDGDKLIFETERGIYAAGITIKNIFAQKGLKGKIVPIEGAFDEPLGRAYDADIYGENEPDAEYICDREEVILRHSFMFGGGRQVFSIRTDSRELVSYIAAGSLEICALSENGIMPVSILKTPEDTVMFEIPFDRAMEDILIIRKRETLEGSVTASELYLGSSAPVMAADFVRNPLMDCDVNEFYPFGETFGLYDECVIGQKLCFSKKGALITVSFECGCERTYVGGEEKSGEKLPLIRRFKKYENEQPLKNVFPDRVLLEYNGLTGWRRLETAEPVQNIFAQEYSGVRNIKFYCPSDWGGEDGEEPMLRLQIISSKHCYEQRCIYHAPLIRNMRISYSYENTVCTPESVTAVCGIDIRNYSGSEFCGGSGKILFDEDDGDTELYICMDKKISEGPVGMYIGRNKVSLKPYEAEFSYYGRGGFKPLPYEWGGGSSETEGVMIFDALPDMEEMDYCGIRGFFIRVKPKTGTDGRYSFKAEKDDWSAALNTVKVNNIDTEAAEDYYIDEIKAGMRVLIHDRDILKIDLWVDETKEYLKSAERKTDEFAPGCRIRTYKDDMGKVSRVLVLWKETDCFEAYENESRVYMLDRGSSSIIFGDGVRHRLPAETEEPAFRVTVYKSGGKRGNVAAGTVTETVSNILFVDGISNISECIGGSDRESEAEKRKRAHMLLKSHGRLITDGDYYREVMNYSPLIRKASVIWDNGRLHIYIITEDFNRRDGSFYLIKRGLEEHLIKTGDALLGEGDIVIEEPVYVEISVELWYEPFEDTDMLYVKQAFGLAMDRYFNPIYGSGGAGWQIGRMPIMPKLMMQLGNIRKWGIIRNMSVTALYEDEGGRQECRLEDLKAKGNMAPISGKHKIHIAAE